MSKKINFAIACFAGFALFAQPGLASQISLEEKIALQSNMQQHIESISVDGVVPHVYLENGSVVDLVPTKAHPMILSFGEKFVLCTDFRNPDGEFVNVDFYMARRGEKFVVFQTEINNRAPLEGLMKSGKVSMLD